INRNSYTFVFLDTNATVPPADLLANPNDPLFQANIPRREVTDPLFAEIASRIVYNSVTKRLGFLGRMTETEKALLLNLMVKNPDGSVVPVTFLDASVVEELYVKSQDVPQVPVDGFNVGGGGTFNIKAKAMDLGISQGIRSSGYAENTALAALTSRSA